MTRSRRDQAHPDRSGKSRGNVRVAVGVDVVLPVEQVFDIHLDAKPRCERHETCRVHTRVPRQENGVVDGGKHLRPADDAECGRGAPMNLVIVPERKRVVLDTQAALPTRSVHRELPGLIGCGGQGRSDLSK